MTYGKDFDSRQVDYWETVGYFRCSRNEVEITQTADAM